MRLLVSILFSFLILKTTIGFELAQLFASDCCVDKTEITLEDTIDDNACGGEEDPCCGDDCHCVCCVHLLINPVIEKAVNEDIVNNYQRPQQYQNMYKLLFQNLVWHPPRQVQ